MPPPRPFFLLSYLDGNGWRGGGEFFDVLVTQELLMLTVMQPGDGEIVFCLHPPLLVVKYLREKGAVSHGSSYGCLIISGK